MAKKATNWQERFFLKAQEILNEPFRRVLDAIFLIYAIVVFIAGIGDKPGTGLDYRPFVLVTIFYSLVKFVVSGQQMGARVQINFLTKWMYFAGICTFVALVVWCGKWMRWWL